MIVGNRLGDVLQQHGFTGARRCHDKRALTLALRADDVDNAREDDDDDDEKKSERGDTAKSEYEGTILISIHFFFIIIILYLVPSFFYHFFHSFVWFLVFMS